MILRALELDEKKDTVDMVCPKARQQPSNLC